MQDVPWSALAETSSHFVNGRPEKTQNYKVNAVISDEISGCLLGQIHGLRFTELDIPEIKEAAQNIMRLSWEADICRLRDNQSLEKLALSRPDTSPLSIGLRLPQTAAFLIALAKHKFATLAVLDLDMLEDEQSELQVDSFALKSHLQSFRRYSSVSKTPQHFSDAQKRPGGIASIDFHIHDATATKDLPFDAEEKFDMVILRIMTTHNDKLRSALAASQAVCSRAEFLVLVYHRALLNDSESASVGSSFSEVGAEISWSSKDHEAMLQSTGFEIQASHHLSDPVTPGIFPSLFMFCFSSSNF